MNLKIRSFPYKSVLIACSVNTARSPMTEGYLKYFFNINGLDVDVRSGGISSNARDGMLISLDAKLAMEEEGIKLSDESLSIDLKKHSEYIKKADLILTLTNRHKEEILTFISKNGIDIYTLKEFAGDSGDIEDPSMKGIDGFRKARDEIKDCIIKGLKRYK
ncbi:MAG: arsenate reductase/protein-tyrosine-phosphatase family protein [Promethearchaeota archaeon]